MSRITSRTVPVEHVTLVSERSFAEVRRGLDGAAPLIDRDIVPALAGGDQARVADYQAHGPALSMMLVRDHGALLQSAGGPRNALQYEIGNPLTATSMTRHELPAALYAPLRVVLYEDDAGHGVFEYDRPSSLFGQYGDERVAEVGRELDAALEAVLRQAAG